MQQTKTKTKSDLIVEKSLLDSSTSHWIRLQIFFISFFLILQNESFPVFLSLSLSPSVSPSPLCLSLYIRKI
jgi:hypothetical protein